jgi:hypothetical protein
MLLQYQLWAVVGVVLGDQNTLFFEIVLLTSLYFLKEYFDIDHKPSIFCVWIGIYKVKTMIYG